MGCPGLVGGSLCWLCLLPTLQWAQGVETAKAHVLLHGMCVCMLVGAAVEMHTQGGIRGGPLQPTL